MPTYEPMLDSSAIPLDGGSADELRLIAALRAGDEDVFLELVDQYHSRLVRMAMHHVPSRADAEVVAVEAWSRLIASADRWDGRTSLRTWLVRTVICDARHRCADAAPDGVSAESGTRRDPPSAWGADALRRLSSTDGRESVGASVAGLPRDQREVVLLRDVWGFSTPEVCDILGLTEPDQRVLLHRGRTTVRDELDDWLQRRAISAQRLLARNASRTSGNSGS
jgi:RNA polymerase sigma-70 factor (ECF subfamily)